MIIAMMMAQMALAAATTPQPKGFTAKLPWKGGYTVTLRLAGGTKGDSGDFTRLVISHKGESDFVLGDKEGLQGQSVRDVRILPKGATKVGGYLQLIPGAAKDGKKFLAFDHYQGGALNDLLYLLGVDSKGEVYIAFQNAVHLAEIRDYDGDGLYDIVSKGGNGEPTGDFTFYDPYLIYRQTEKDGQLLFKKDEELSKKFSAENNYEWHGSAYSSDVRMDAKGREVK